MARPVGGARRLGGFFPCHGFEQAIDGIASIGKSRLGQDRVDDRLVGLKRQELAGEPVAEADPGTVGSWPFR